MSLPVIVTPDVVLWATDWLRTALVARSEDYASDVHVSISRPNAEAWKNAHPATPYPAKIVTVRRDGGPRADLLHSTARLGVNVWASSEQEVIDLARLAEGLLLSVRASDPVESVSSQAGPTDIADVQPRRYFTVELVVRGVVVAS